jgi:hypothetical protein
VPVTTSTSSLSFGNLTVGSVSAAKTVTIQSRQHNLVTISGIAITGNSPGDFVQSATTCGATLTSYAACTISVTFNPTAKGLRTASLTISDSASNSPQTVALNGTGK